MVKDNKLKKQRHNGEVRHKARFSSEQNKENEKEINPVVLRNRLASEYNRLIREGNPDTKKLREQIHEQIQKIEGD